MRSSLLAVTALLAVAHVACSGDPGSNEGGSDPSPSAPGGEQAVPSQDLASATVPGDPGTGTGTGTGTSRNGDSYAPIGEQTGTGSNPGNPGSGSSSGGSSSGGTPVDPNAGAGSPPTTTCTVTKDSAGFFTRNSGTSTYVAYVPASYKPTAPMRLIVGVHGCGDNAANFATWGVAPYDTRATQQHIAISIGGRDGQCWTASDDVKVLAAVADISKCFWVHQKKIVLAGFSSGGELAYRLGLSQAAHFAGLLIEDSGLYAANSNPNGLLAGAAWKLHIAHRAHTSDTVFPIATVKADWVKTAAAGFPLVTSETPGGHDGTSTDWASWLIPQSATWVAP